MAQSISQEAIGATGLPGATAASRHAGATTSGAPTSGTFAVGDYIIDQTGAMYVCTVAGTPGTWQLSGVSVNENIAGKNFVINGGMDIWQRGTTFATGGGYTADRWYCYASGNAVAETQVASGLTGFKYALQVQRNSGQTSTSAIYATQSIETLNTLPMAGQIVNLSFWAKCGANYSGTSNQLTVQLIAGTGTDQNVISGFTGATALFGNTVNLSTSWQRFTVQTNSFLTASVASTYTQLGINFIEVPTGTAGANDWFQITGVQLEIGSTATAFSRAGGTIQGELAACQRYLPAFYPPSSAGADFFLGYAYATNATLFFCNFNVPARVPPTGITPTGTFNALALNSPTTVTPSFNSANQFNGSILASQTIVGGQGSRMTMAAGALLLFTGCEL